MIDKSKVFADEISCIEDDSVREFTQKAVEILPDYFFTVPASSTGKYHPRYALGDGGLVRHVKAAARIAIDLLNLDCFKQKFDEETRSALISAVILHDGCKSGNPGGKYTAFDHPLIVVDLLEHSDVKNLVERSVFDKICLAISSHMGQWSHSDRSSVVLPVPISEEQIFVHMCDYLASRKYLIYENENGEYNPKNYEFATDIDVLRKQVVDKCIAAIQNGADRNELYAKIESIAGVKNPNAIKDVEILNRLLGEI